MPAAENHYAGWKPPPGTKLDVLDVHSTTAQELWSHYISCRKPVLIQGHLTDPEWKASSKWTDEYLAQKAGSCQLMVEVRQDEGAMFGQGRKQAMAFKDFIAAMQRADDSLYLTTQQVPIASDGHPALYGQLLQQLSGDFPVQPKLLGNLVPQALNVWMGCAKSGSSSGLHHDFHDNLYVLLRGKKRFRLWDPSHAPHMHTHGKVAVVHPNGRIVYQGQGEVRADGSSAREAAAWAARNLAEARVSEAEHAVQQGQAGAAAQLSAAESALDALLETQLAAAIDGAGSDEGDDMMEGLQDDYVDDDGDLDEDDNSSSEDMDQEDDPAGAAGLSAGRRGLGEAPRKAKHGHKGSQAPAADEGSKQKQDSVQITQEEEDPPSFCTGVNVELTDKQLRQQYPDFPGKAAMLEVWVEAGQMLYLPAGWFHEVTSFSEPNTTSDDSSSSTHLAFNYWMHPPDNLDPTDLGFKQPYTSDYWPSLWKARCATMAAPQRQHSALIRRDSFENVKVDELDGATGHDPHRGPRHSFDGVRVDELDGATGHDPHRGRQHSFDGVKVDELDGATGHDPHRGPRHSFDGVKVDELVEAALRSPHQAGPGSEQHPADMDTDGPPSTKPTVEQGHAATSTARPETEAAVSGRRKSRKSAAPKRLSDDSGAQAVPGQQVGGETAAVPEPDAAAEVRPVAAAAAAGKKRRMAQDTVAAVGSQEEAEASPAATGQAGRKAKRAATDKRQPQEEEEGGEGDVGEGEGEEEGLLEGDEGELGEMVAKEMHEYFSSTEGAGAFRLALGKYLMEAMAKEAAKEQAKKGRTARQRGRRHHRVVRSMPSAENAAADDNQDDD